MERSKRIVGLFILLVVFSSCEKKPNHNTKKEIESDRDLIINKDSLINNSLSGDKKALNKLLTYYLLEYRANEILHILIYSANKYDNIEAHYFIYQVLNGKYSRIKLSELDDKTYYFAMYHLMKSYEGGYMNAVDKVELLEEDGRDIQKSSYYLDKYYNMSISELKTKKKINKQNSSVKPLLPRESFRVVK